MENINCYIVSNQRHLQEHIRRFIEITNGLKLEGLFEEASIAVHSIDNALLQTLVLIDIDMGGLEFSPMDLYKSVSHFAKVIFTTILLKEEVEDYVKLGDDLIFAPISYERFLKSIQNLFPETFV